MIRDGAKEVSLRYLAEQPRYFSIGQIPIGTVLLVSVGFHGIVVDLSVAEQGQNIRDYARYLQVRVQAWKDLKYDYASQNTGGEQAGRLKDLKVEKGLLRETETLLRLVAALLKCKVDQSSHHVLILVLFGRR
jgi:phosphatidylinositol-binding clathrin assembly protein